MRRATRVRRFARSANADAVARLSIPRPSASRSSCLRLMGAFKCFFVCVGSALPMLRVAPIASGGKRIKLLTKHAFPPYETRSGSCALQGGQTQTQRAALDPAAERIAPLNLASCLRRVCDAVQQSTWRQVGARRSVRNSRCQTAPTFALRARRDRYRSYHERHRLSSPPHRLNSGVCTV
jgi:hypothetical protein